MKSIDKNIIYVATAMFALLGNIGNAACNAPDGKQFTIATVTVNGDTDVCVGMTKTYSTTITTFQTGYENNLSTTWSATGNAFIGMYSGIITYQKSTSSPWKLTAKVSGTGCSKNVDHYITCYEMTVSLSGGSTVNAPGSLDLPTTAGSGLDKFPGKVSWSSTEGSVSTSSMNVSSDFMTLTPVLICSEASHGCNIVVVATASRSTYTDSIWDAKTVQTCNYSLYSQYQQLEQEIIQLESEIEQLNRQIAPLESRLAPLEIQVADLQSYYDFTVSDQINDIRIGVEDAWETWSTVGTTVAAFISLGQYGVVRATTTYIYGGIKTMAGNLVIDALDQVANDEFGADNEATSGSINYLQSQISQLENQIGVLEGQMQSKLNERQQKLAEKNALNVCV